MARPLVSVGMLWRRSPTGIRLRGHVDVCGWRQEFSLRRNSRTRPGSYEPDWLLVTTDPPRRVTPDGPTRGPRRPVGGEGGENRPRVQPA